MQQTQVQPAKRQFLTVSLNRSDVTWW